MKFHGFQDEVMGQKQKMDDLGTNPLEKLPQGFYFLGGGAAGY